MVVAAETTVTTQSIHRICLTCFGIVQAPRAIVAHQKSICAPNLNRRPARICVGFCQTAPLVPYVLLTERAGLALKRLYMSKMPRRFTVPPSLIALEKRRSNSFSLSPYNRPGGTMLIVAVVL